MLFFYFKLKWEDENPCCEIESIYTVVIKLHGLEKYFLIFKNLSTPVTL